MNTILKIRFGSHLYGTNTLNSDTDYKSIYLPTKEDCYLNRIQKSITNNTKSNQSTKNTSTDVDEEIYSLQYFLKLLQNNEMIAIDMLHANNENIITNSPLWTTIQSNREQFYTKSLSGYLGYIKTQAHKYSIKGSRLNTAETLIEFFSQFKPKDRLDSIWDQIPDLPHTQKLNQFKSSNLKHLDVCGKYLQESSTIKFSIDVLNDFYNKYGHRAIQAKNNQNIDWKAISHAFRAAYQIREILTTSNLIFPLKERDFLINLKLGKYHYINDSIPNKLDDLVNEVNDLVNNSKFPSKIDQNLIDNLILNAYK